MGLLVRYGLSNLNLVRLGGLARHLTCAGGGVVTGALPKTSENALTLGTGP